MPRPLDRQIWRGAPSSARFFGGAPGGAPAPACTGTGPPWGRVHLRDGARRCAVAPVAGRVGSHDGVRALRLHPYFQVVFRSHGGVRALRRRPLSRAAFRLRGGARFFARAAGFGWGPVARCDGAPSPLEPGCLTYGLARAHLCPQVALRPRPHFGVALLPVRAHYARRGVLT